MKRYVIVGNGVAADSAAVRIREIDNTASIDMFSREEIPFYYRPRLIDYLAREITVEKFTLHTAEWYRERNINLHLSTDISSIDRDAREAAASDGKTYPYDSLLLATGADCFVPPIAGVNNHPGRVFTIKTTTDVDRILQVATSSRTALVIGGGLLGLETANSLSKLGVTAKVIEFFPRLLPRQLDARGGRLLQSLLEERGLEFFLDDVSERIEGNDSTVWLYLKSSRILGGGLIIVSAGVRPDLKLARQAGLQVGKGLVVDDHMKTSDAHIYGAGDVIEHGGRLYGTWQPAKEQGEVAGAGMAGRETSYQGTISPVRLKVAGIDLAAIGEIDGDGMMDSKVFEEERIYRKAVLRDGALVGAILLGSASGDQAIAKAVRDGATYESVRDIFESPVRS